MTGHKSIQHWQKVSLAMLAYDTIVVNLSYGITLWLRFDLMISTIPNELKQAWLNFVPLYTVFCVVVFWRLRLYSSIWRFASYAELARVVVGSLVAAVFHTVCITVLFCRMPLFYYVVGALIQLVLLLTVRFSYRFVLLLRRAGKQASDDNIMLVGAGSAGQMILRDLNNSPEANGRVVCIIDDNPNKWNRYVDNVPVVGGREDILANVHKYDVKKIYLALPSATAEQRRDILDICKETGCELKNLPGTLQLARGEVYVSSMRDVSVEDLLGREPIRADLTEVFEFINGKTVLVTGGGGSIGSELCRQIAAHNPRQLVIFDVYENNAYSIQMELRERYPYLNLVTLIGSVRDSRRIMEVMATYKPQIVYHAAAHKHVPLMEDSPCEAIKNNAMGTYKTAFAALTSGCERFVLISTDKAVNPTNIMGASKRLCEMIIQTFDAKTKAGCAKDLSTLLRQGHTEQRGAYVWEVADLSSAHTEFVAVRFGNVLGSNGSVIPLFKKQIEKGGPVTVTHPDIVRYFMTIPEAVSLVMLAGTFAKGGEIFVLDMGEPVKIDTLARNLIKLSGLKPDVDIKVAYTGLRPGEKLYEEKLMAEEGLTRTDNDLIHVGRPIAFDMDAFLQGLIGLMEAAYDNDPTIRQHVAHLVNTYKA